MISDELMFVGIHVNRTGGSSRERMLKSYCRPFDGEERRHSLAVDLYKILGRQLWDLYFSFAFVRNPWDRMVSIYHHRRWVPNPARHTRARLPFKEWLFCEKTEDGTFGEQAQWVMRDGKVIVDFVGRFESLEWDWGIVCDRLGVDLALPHANKSGRLEGSYRQYYDAESRDFVAKLCERDLKLFGYTF